MRRSLLFSCAVHGVIALILVATTPRRAPPEPVGAVEVALVADTPPSPAVAAALDEPAQAGGGGAALPTASPVASSLRKNRRRSAPVRTATAETSPASEPAPETPGPPAAANDQAPGDGSGAGTGTGLGEGFGHGFGAGAGGTETGEELHARVLGNEIVDVRPRQGSPTISHEEATTLRTRDSFPRLPESAWPEWRPYIVKLEICVAEDGRVREAALRSSASARLDPVVLAAARTWQYRPRLVDGKPTPFCHGVVIKYERW
jgi:hypothetical protein